MTILVGGLKPIRLFGLNGKADARRADPRSVGTWEPPASRRPGPGHLAPTVTPDLGPLRKIRGAFSVKSPMIPAQAKQLIGPACGQCTRGSSAIRAHPRAGSVTGVGPRVTIRAAIKGSLPPIGWPGLLEARA